MKVKRFFLHESKFKKLLEKKDTICSLKFCCVVNHILPVTCKRRNLKEIEALD
jgi:hypothetical protein